MKPRLTTTGTMSSRVHAIAIRSPIEVVHMPKRVRINTTQIMASREAEPTVGLMPGKRTMRIIPPYGTEQL